MNLEKKLLLKILLDFRYSYARGYFKAEIVNNLKTLFNEIKKQEGILFEKEIVIILDSILTHFLGKEKEYSWLFNSVMCGVNEALEDYIFQKINGITILAKLETESNYQIKNME